MVDLSAVSTSSSSSTLYELADTEVDKQAFLNLLVTQLRSQDPFDPVKNEDFLAQLAQFSSLESLNNIYEQMSASTLLQNSVHNALSTSLLGNYAVIDGNAINVNGDTVSEAVFSLADPGNVTIEILDGAGNVVRKIAREDLAAGEHTVQWDGKNADGNAVENGEYTVRVTHASGTSAGEEVDVYTVGKIRAVRFIGGSPVIVIGSTEYSLSDVIEVMDELPESNG